MSSDRDRPVRRRWRRPPAGRRPRRRPSKALAAARAKLILGRDAKSAFFATLVLRLTPEPAWDLDTLATDGRVLPYHPPFVAGLSPDELVGVLAHEVMHCALAHPARRGGRDPAKWNVACDLAVNPLLLPAGVVLPAGRLMPGEGPYAGLRAGQGGRGVLRRPAGRTRPAGSRRTMPDRRHGRPGRVRGGDRPGGRGPGREPGQSRPSGRWPSPRPSRRPPAGGRCPAGLGRAVEAVLHPPADWRARPAGVRVGHARNDYSWARPNRRFLAQGLYLPGLHSRGTGRRGPRRGHVRVDRRAAARACSPPRRTPSWPRSTARSPSCTTTPRSRRSRPGSRPTGRWSSTRSAAAGRSHCCVFDWLDRVGPRPGLRRLPDRPGDRVPAHRPGRPGPVGRRRPGPARPRRSAGSSPCPPDHSTPKGGAP